MTGHRSVGEEKNNELMMTHGRHMLTHVCTHTHSYIWDQESPLYPEFPKACSRTSTLTCATSTFSFQFTKSVLPGAHRAENSPRGIKAYINSRGANTMNSCSLFNHYECLVHTGTARCCLYSLTKAHKRVRALMRQVRTEH